MRCFTKIIVFLLLLSIVNLGLLFWLANNPEKQQIKRQSGTLPNECFLFTIKKPKMFLIEPKPLLANVHRGNVLCPIYVKTRPESYEERMAIRTTYGRLANEMKMSLLLPSFWSADILCW